MKCTLRERSKRAFASREYRGTTDWTEYSKKQRLAEYYWNYLLCHSAVPLTMDRHLECVSWEFRQPNTNFEPINEPLVDEIMDFVDIIYRNNNYVENLHATGNNENKNIIFIQQFYIPKQKSKITIKKQQMKSTKLLWVKISHYIMIIIKEKKWKID